MVASGDVCHSDSKSLRAQILEEVSTMDLLQGKPIDGIASHVHAVLDDGETALLQARSDMDALGDYGAQWVVVTRKRILVLREGGTRDTVDIPLEDVRCASTEPLVGGAELEIERKALPTIRVLHSQTQTGEFSELARGIERLRTSQPLMASMAPERNRCESCGRLLPEKNGICPACLKRMDVLARIAGYLTPYRLRVALLALATILTTAAELIPPQITRLIVDDVLAPEAASAVGDRLELLVHLVLALVGVRLITWGAEWLHGWTATWLSARVTADIRSQLLPLSGIAIASVLRQAARGCADVSCDQGHRTIAAFPGGRVAVSRHQQPDVFGYRSGVAVDELAPDALCAHTRAAGCGRNSGMLEADAPILCQMVQMLVGIDSSRERSPVRHSGS